MQQMLIELKNIKSSISANHSWPFLPSGVHKLQARNFFLKYKMWNYGHYIGNRPSKETGHYLLSVLTQENPYCSYNYNNCIPWTHESVIFHYLVMIPWKSHAVATLGCPHRFSFFLLIQPKKGLKKSKHSYTHKMVKQRAVGKNTLNHWAMLLPPTRWID